MTAAPWEVWRHGGGATYRFVGEVTLNGDGRPELRQVNWVK
jgi:hypothetical protein